MHKMLIAGLFMSGSLACSDSRRAEDSNADRVSGFAPGALAAGTTIQATIQDSISSRTSRIGSRIHAIVSRNVLDAAGHVAIAGGASVELTIVQLTPAAAASADGVVVLGVASLTGATTTYALSATVGLVAHNLVGRNNAAIRDVIVGPGTPVTITLAQPLKISATLGDSASDRVHMHHVRSV